MKNFFKKLKYQFDKRMARGNASMIRILVTFTVLAAILIAAVITFSTPVEDRDFRMSLWDALATAINAWMPYSEEGDAVYLILTALAAVIGLLFTSLLIGIITNAVEEKVDSLKEGNSLVMEKDHIVVLGFTPGDYSLIGQLVAMAGKNKQSIVIASALSRSETEEAIRENVEIPRNVTVIARTVEPGDMTALRNCALDTCRTVILNGASDSEDKKGLLAAHALLQESGNTGVCILEASAEDDLDIPDALAKDMHHIAIPVRDLISRLIAFSCTETGISSVYREIFEIGGDDLQFGQVPGTVGRSFGEIVKTLWGVTPVGVLTPVGILLNEGYDHILTAEDQLIFWGNEAPKFNLVPEETAAVGILPETLPAHAVEKVLIVGFSSALPEILSSFPEQPMELFVCNVPEEEQEVLKTAVADRQDLSLNFTEVDFDREETLFKKLEEVDHVILLPEDTKEADEADLTSIFRMMSIRSGAERIGRKVTITMELRDVKNLQLVSGDRYTDFIVAPHIVSMALVQLCVRPEIEKVLKLLLSNEGSEIHMKTPAELGVFGAFSALQFRMALLKKKMILLGSIENGEIKMNPSPDAVFSAEKVESFVVLSEK